MTEPVTAQCSNSRGASGPPPLNRHRYRWGVGGCKQKSGQSKEGKKLFQKRSAMTEKKRNKRGPGKAESKREDDEERAQHVWDDLGRRTKASAALRPDRRPQFESDSWFSARQHYARPPCTPPASASQEQFNYSDLSSTMSQNSCYPSKLRSMTRNNNNQL